MAEIFTQSLSEAPSAMNHFAFGSTPTSSSSVASCTRPCLPGGCLASVGRAVAHRRAKQRPSRRAKLPAHWLATSVNRVEFQAALIRDPDDLVEEISDDDLVACGPITSARSAGARNIVLISSIVPRRPSLLLYATSQLARSMLLAQAPQNI